MSLETVRISKRGKDQLLWLKRHTKIGTWNVLSRWAFCVSLAEVSPPRDIDLSGEAPIEMAWKTFGGDLQEIYRALLINRCLADHIEPTPDNLEHQMRLHIHRGIGYLAGDRDLRSIERLVARIPHPQEPV